MRRVFYIDAHVGDPIDLLDRLAYIADDGGVIVRNTIVTSPAGVWRAFALPYWPDAIGGGQYRPLGILSFALDWLMAGTT